MANESKIYDILNSLMNGQRKQMTKQIDEYGLYDFWEDFKNYLQETNLYSTDPQNDWFADCVISYHRIKNQ